MHKRYQRIFNFRICKKYNYVYIHKPRTAGNSIEEALKKLPRTRRDFKNKFPLPKHSKPNDVLNLVGKNMFDKAFKFGFVRNPWDMILSLYCWNIERMNVAKNRYINFSEFKDFNDFVQSERFQNYKYINEPYEYIAINNDIVLDYVGKFETIDEDWNNICKILNIPNASLEYINGSVHNDYRKYYDNKSIEIVRKKFEKIIEKFEYEF